MKIGLFIVSLSLMSFYQGVSASPSGSSVADRYVKTCSVCHGREGDGRGSVNGLKPPPRNFTSLEAAQNLDRERMVESITNGRTGTAMSGFGKKFSSQEIEELVDYIRGNFMRVSGKGGVKLTAHDKKMASGKSIYENNCGVCHGDGGASGVWAQNGLHPAPRDFTAPIAQQELLARERMIFSVKTGRKGTAMMPFEKRLSAEEIEAVVDYIRLEFMGLGVNDRVKDTVVESKPVYSDERNVHATMSEAPQQRVHGGNMAQLEADMELPLPQGLKGDVAKGRDFFMSNCFTCHGKKGDGNGPRAYFINPRPRNFTNELSGITMNRPAIFKAITNGKPRTVMPAWGKVLSDQEIANLAEFVFQTFIRPER